MKRFVNALFQSARAKSLEEFFQPYLGLNAEALEDYHGSFQDILAAEMVKRLRKEGLAHPRIPDKAFETMTAALKAAETPTPPERRTEPCKSPS